MSENDEGIPKISAVKRLKNLVPLVLSWYQEEGKIYPWRTKVTPYKVLISEIMLQQTLAATVANRFPQFLATFPSLRILAQAELPDVIRAWQGLGYNRRARHIHLIAKEVITHHHSRLPRDNETLRSLPGIGEYTASAIQSFAFRKDVVIVDVNIQRVLSRVYARQEFTDEVLKRQLVHRLDAELLPIGESSAWHQGLMDIGSRFCTKRDPDCAGCPLLAQCPNSFKLKARLLNPKDEPTILGVPRRLWRGKLLKIIVERRAVSTKEICSDNFLDLTANYLQAPSRIGFEHQLADVLEQLKSDGLIVKHRNKWNLAS